MIIVNGKKIQDLRLKNGLTLDKLARSVGCGVAMLSQVENGEKQPGVILLKRIANYFGLTVDELIIEIPPLQSQSAVGE